jgi:hypothetical protein
MIQMHTHGEHTPARGGASRLLAEQKGEIMPLSKEQEETTMSWSWIKENAEAIMLAARLQREGFDVKRYLKDYLNGEAKDPEDYRVGGGIE